MTECMNSMIQQTRDEQGRATTIFEDMYRKMEIGIAVLVVYDADHVRHGAKTGGPAADEMQSEH